MYVRDVFRIVLDCVNTKINGPRKISRGHGNYL